MKDLIPKIKEKLMTKLGIAIGIIVLLLVAVLIYFKLLGYVMIILVIIAFFYISKQGEKENQKIVSPWEKEKRNKEIAEIQERIDIVQAHLNENGADLDAKLKLKELNDELRNTREKYDL